MKILCKIFDHKMYFDGANVAGPSTCKRCGHKKLGVNWNSICPPMPPVKEPKQ